MINNSKVLAVIPARGGSKRLPGKNLLTIGGKPMLGWTIDAAKNCQYFDQIVVSTDDKNILEFAEKSGVSCPFVRPDQLATDTASSIDVVLHAVSFFRSNGQIFDIVVLLQPTSPLRLTIDITKSIEIFVEHEANAVVSVCQAEHHPHWTGIIGKNGSMENFFQQNFSGKRSQDLPTMHRLNGAIYCAKTDFLEENKSFFSSKTYSYVMPQTRSVDVDSMLDFKLAELLFSENLESK